MLENEEGNIIFGTYNGLNILNTKTNTISKYLAGTNSALNTVQVTAIFVDSKERFWVATQNGLFVKAKGNAEFKSFVNNAKNPTSIITNNTKRIGEDDHGNVVIGTENGGLKLFDEKKLILLSILIHGIQELAAT